MNPERLLQHPLPRQKCTTGCPIIDTCLCGGIPCKSITEIVAESGTGKTQTCLQLCLYSQLPESNGGLHASSIYLHTEFRFPSRRLHQLSTSFTSKYPEIKYNPSDHIFVQSVHSVHQLLDILLKLESFVANASTEFPVRLIVIDSIAALFRSEYENTKADLVKRSSLFFKISAKLKELAMRYDMAVVITNQVVDAMGSGENGLRIGNLESLCTSGRRVCAALGLAWANCVNSRLFLSRVENVVGRGGDHENGGLVVGLAKRQLHVVFAPHLPASSCEFVITKDGVFGVNR